LDPAQARLTVKELCEKYLATVTHQAAGTVRQKKEITGGSKSSGRSPGQGFEKVADSDLAVFV